MRYLGARFCFRSSTTAGASISTRWTTCAGIHLRGFAQIDPLVAYKNEGFTMFRELMASIWEEFTRVIFHVEVNIEPAQAQQMFGEEDRAAGREVQYAGGGPEQPSAMAQAASAPRGAGSHRGRPSRRDARRPGRLAGNRGLARGDQPGHRGQGRAGKDRSQRPLLVRLGKKYKCHGA